MASRTILYLHPHFTLNGGAGKFVLETAQRLNQKGYQIKVISLHSSPSIVKPYTQYIDFIDLGGPLSSSIWFWFQFPLTLRKVFKILDAYPQGIVFPQVFPSNWWGFLYKWWRPQRQVVWMCQEPSAFIHSAAWIQALPWTIVKVCLVICLPLLRVIDVFLAQHIDHVFCNSNFTLKQAQKIYSYSAQKAQTLYLGADLKMFHPLGLKRQPKIVTVCRLTKFKNVDVILEALSLLNQNRTKPVTLTIIGDGEERQNLLKRTRELKLEKVVTFRGHLPHIKAVVDELNSAKAFVLASINEPFGLAPVEAMACGTPAVVSNSGGMKETVLDNLSGFHFEGGNPRALSRVLANLIDNSHLFTRLSNGALKRASAFTWDKTTVEVENTFKKLT
jgi:glycosyltransferase involved in cell wall biosynthesis